MVNNIRIHKQMGHILTPYLEHKPEYQGVTGAQSKTTAPSICNDSSLYTVHTLTLKYQEEVSDYTLRTSVPQSVGLYQVS